MCMWMYCYRRHMGNQVYQIQYKICMFAEMKTSVKFIRIPFLGKAPDPTINNTIPCSLSLLCHRYAILSICFSKAYLLPYRNPSQQPYFPSERHLIQTAEKEKSSRFLWDLFLQEVWSMTCEENHHLRSLDRARQQSRQQGVPVQRVSSSP